MDETKTGAAFQRPIVGRAAAYADIDSDGDIDLLFVGNGQQALLYRNDQSLGNNWLRVKLKGKANNPEAIGATITIENGNAKLHRLVSPTRSYLSQCELPATFGFGAGKPSKLTVQWADGSEQSVEIPKLNVLMTVEQN